jgi:hypothetical protein
MRERGLLVRSRRLRARRKKEWGRVEVAGPNQVSVPRWCYDKIPRARGIPDWRLQQKVTSAQISFVVRSVLRNDV